MAAQKKLEDKILLQVTKYASIMSLIATFTNLGIGLFANMDTLDTPTFSCRSTDEPLLESIYAMVFRLSFLFSNLEIIYN